MEGGGISNTVRSCNALFSSGLTNYQFVSMFEEPLSVYSKSSHPRLDLVKESEANQDEYDAISRSS